MRRWLLSMNFLGLLVVATNAWGIELIRPYASFTPGDASDTNTDACYGALYGETEGVPYYSAVGILIACPMALQTESLDIRIVTDFADLASEDVLLNLNYFREDATHHSLEAFGVSPLNGDLFHAELHPDGIATISGAVAPEGLFMYDLSFNNLQSAQIPLGAGVISVSFTSPTATDGFFFGVAASNAPLDPDQQGYYTDDTTAPYCNGLKIEGDLLPGVPAIAPTFSEVPEPSTLALAATGLCGLLAFVWRKRSR